MRRALDAWTPTLEAFPWQKATMAAGILIYLAAHATLGAIAGIAFLHDLRATTPYAPPAIWLEYFDLARNGALGAMGVSVVYGIGKRATTKADVIAAEQAARTAQEPAEDPGA